jgi:hypothetical protein
VRGPGINGQDADRGRISRISSDVAIEKGRIYDPARKRCQTFFVLSWPQLITMSAAPCLVRARALAVPVAIHRSDPLDSSAVSSPVVGGMVAILITAGPTREYLDDVRFLSNGSSGRMGCALAEAALADGHETYLVLGPVERQPPAGARVRSVTSALEMQAAAEEWFERCQVAIAAAAVADWRPAHRQPGKPRHGAIERLELIPNPDIVAGLGARKGARVVVGFALESAAASWPQTIERGREKLARKQLDLVVCNRADAIGSDGSAAVLLFADGRQLEIGRQDKLATAQTIVRAAVQLHERRAS